MFQDLPSRIDKRLDPDVVMKRKRKFHPRMLDEVFHFSMKSEDPSISFLIMISMLKEDLPWLYEIGLETYESLKNSKTKTEKAISTFNGA